MSQENVEIVLESIRRFRPSGLDEWAELWLEDGLLIECAVRWRVEDALEAAGLEE